MSRKLLALLVAGLTVLALATYVYYRRTLAAVPVDAYALVPDDAVLVLATRDHPALVRHLQEAGVWDNITGVRYFQQVAGQLALVDSLQTGGQPAPPNPLTGRRRDLLALLGNKLVITSLHVTGPRQVDVLYQVPLASIREYRQAQGILETLARDPRYTLGTRDYEGYELQELTRRGGERLTVLNYRNHLVLSTHAPLVEAVVHRLEHPGAPTLRAGFSSTDLLRLREVDATVFVSFRRVPALLDVLFQPGSHTVVDQALALAQDGLLGLKFGAGQLTLTGFANPETAANSWQRQLQGQPAQPLRPLADVLPLRTALALSVAGRLAVPAVAAGPDATWRAALDSLRGTLEAGTTLVYLAAPAPGVTPAQVVLLRSRQPARTAAWLARLRRAGGVSPAFGRVGGYELFAGGAAGPALLGSLAPGPAPATALAGSYLAFGPEADLRAYLGELAAGRVWGRSPAQVALLQQLLPQSRLGILADLRQGWNALIGTLAEDRRAGLLRNEGLLRHYPLVAWQLLPPDAAAPAGSQFFAQAVLRRPGQAPDSAAGTGVAVRFGAALRGQPLLLPATTEAGLPALLLTDSLGVVRRLPLGGRAAAWADTLPGPVLGEVRLLRGQVLLASARHLALLDAATGAAAPDFPLNLPDTLTVAGVTAALNPGPVPRLLVATAARDLLLLDTHGRQYPGWPRRLAAPLAGPPQLLSVGGRLVAVASLINGYVYAFDQGGGVYPGFPVSVGARLAGPLLLHPAATLARSTVTLVNQHGELLTLSLSGDVVTRQRVGTWSRTAAFQLVPEAGGRPGSFVVVRQDAGRLTVFGPPAGGLAPVLLDQQELTSGDKPVQWFDFGPGHQVLALTEPGPALVRLFDGHGQPLGRSATPAAAGTWPSTGTGIALRYDAATHRYQLLRYLRRRLLLDTVSE